MRKFLPFGLVLVLVFFSSMALSHIPQGVTASDDMSIGKVGQVSRYQVSGDRQGKVTVRDTVTGEVIRTFVMDEGVVVRETFILDNGRTVAASQKDHAVFWDLATGREIGRVNQRVYGFSDDETKFFTFDNGQIYLYAYPTLTQICQITKERQLGPGGFRFSPDSRFLVVGSNSGFPSEDEYYPNPNPVFSRGIYSVELFNLQTCQQVEEFSKLRFRIRWFDYFSADSRFLYVRFSGSGEVFSEELWRFNMTTYEFEKVSD